MIFLSRKGAKAQRSFLSFFVAKEANKVHFLELKNHIQN